jgi:hypothetical protein
LPEVRTIDGARRSAAIAIARVVCILGVVYVHAWTGLNGEALKGLRGSGQENLRWVLMEMFGRSAVPLLGLISGWLVATSSRTRDWREHIGRKARTILLPMALWNIIAILLVSGAALQFGLSAPVPKSAGWLVNEVLIITRNPDINVQMPFLRDLFLCMVAAPLLVRLPNWSLALIAAVAAGCHVAGFGPPVLMRASILVFFTLGILAQRGGWAERVANRPMLIVAIPFALLMAVQLYHAVTVGDDAWPVAQRALDLALRIAAAGAFWRFAWALAASPARPMLLRIEPYAFFLFSAHLILIWLFGPVLGGIFGKLGTPFYPFYLILQPFMVLGFVILIGAALRRIAPGAAAILSGGRLKKPERQTVSRLATV